VQLISTLELVGGALLHVVLVAAAVTLVLTGTGPRSLDAGIWPLLNGAERGERR
jgi:hypothetical protein